MDVGGERATTLLHENAMAIRFPLRCEPQRMRLFLENDWRDWLGLRD